MGRKKFLVGCSLKQYDTWKEAADNVGLSVSAWLRLVADTAVSYDADLYNVSVGEFTNKCMNNINNAEIHAKERKRFRIGDAELKSIRLRYKQGESQQSIADSFGVTQGYISFLIKSCGVNGKLPKLQKSDIPNILSYRNDGCSYAAIGRLYGVPGSSISNLLQKYEVKC